MIILNDFGKVEITKSEESNKLEKSITYNKIGRSEKFTITYKTLIGDVLSEDIIGNDTKNKVLSNIDSDKIKKIKENLRNKFKESQKIKEVQESSGGILKYAGELENIPLRFYRESTGTDYDIYSIEDFSNKRLKLAVGGYAVANSKKDVTILSDGKAKSKEQGHELGRFLDNTFKKYDKYVTDPKRKLSKNEFVIKLLEQLIDVECLFLTEVPVPVTYRTNIWSIGKFVQSDETSKELSQKCKYLLDWTNRLASREHQEIFMQWIGSILDSDNKGRGMLFLIGKGKLGKSLFTENLTKFLESRFGNVHASISMNKTSSNFFMSEVQSARLVVVPDTDSRDVVRNDKLKNLTGADSVSIEGKFKDSFTRRLYAKVIVQSNYSQYVDFNFPEQYSRYLGFVLNASYKSPLPTLLDCEWDSVFKNEMPYFVELCWRKYVKVSGGFENLGTDKFKPRTDFNINNDGTYTKVFENGKKNSRDIYSGALTMFVDHYLVKNTQSEVLLKDLHYWLEKFFETKGRSTSNGKQRYLIDATMERIVGNNEKGENPIIEGSFFYVTPHGQIPCLYGVELDTTEFKNYEEMKLAKEASYSDQLIELDIMKNDGMPEDIYNAKKEKLEKLLKTTPF